MRKHCLVVTKFLPLPDDSGGAQRTLATLRVLLRHVDVTMVAFSEETTDLAGLRDLGVEVRTTPWPTPVPDAVLGLARTRSPTSARYWSRRLAADVEDVVAARPVDLLLLEYAQMAPYLRSAPHVALFSHNVESALLGSYARTSSRVMRPVVAIDAFAVRRLERRVLRRVDMVSVVSEVDRDRLPPTRADVLVCPNGTRLAEEVVPAATEPVVVFVGQLGWAPNADAARWLAQEVWPLVEASTALEARLLLVGRNPGPEVRALASDRIEVVGSVPSVEPYLRRARVATAPLRAGGGSRLKIIEALAASRPVVATTVGAEGLEDLLGTGIVTADDPRSFADALVGLLERPDEAAALGASGRAAVRARYSWDTTLRPLEQWIDEHVR